MPVLLFLLKLIKVRRNQKFYVSVSQSVHLDVHLYVTAKTMLSCFKD